MSIARKPAHKAETVRPAALEILDIAVKAILIDYCK